MIAWVIASVNSEKPGKIKLDDFLLDFEVRGKERKKEITPEQAELNKKMFLASIGVGMKKVPTRKIPRLPKGPDKTQRRNRRKRP